MTKNISSSPVPVLAFLPFNLNAYETISDANISLLA